MGGSTEDKSLDHRSEGESLASHWMWFEGKVLDKLKASTEDKNRVLCYLYVDKTLD